MFIQERAHESNTVCWSYYVKMNCYEQQLNCCDILKTTNLNENNYIRLFAIQNTINLKTVLNNQMTQ